MPRGEPVRCVPCEKDNHEHCLVEVVDVASGNVIICECGQCWLDNHDGESPDGESVAISYYAPGPDWTRGGRWND